MNAIDAAYHDKFIRPEQPDHERTMSGYTTYWNQVVPHIVVNGVTLTPRIRREKHGNGWHAVTIAGKPMIETTYDGKIVYATPGGGSYIGG